MRSRVTQVSIVLAVLSLLGVTMAGLLTGWSGTEDQASELEQRLRCPTCASVSIAESPSDTATAMRTVVAEQVAAGRTDQQIIDYFRARYGDWVLLDPPAKGQTLPLWLLPFAALAVGAVVLIFLRGRRSPEPGDDVLDPAQLERVARAVEQARAKADREEVPAMSVERERLEQVRDQALADIVDLERQVADDEIPNHAAVRLRRQYEATAARAMEELETQPPEETTTTAQRPRSSRRRRGRLVAYVSATAVAVFAALVLLPQYVAERPEGGFISGNEVIQSPAGAPSSSAQPPRDLSTVTEAEMEQVVAANPNVLGMRLALARRYVEKGQYDKASEHYGVALTQAPDDPQARSSAAWLLHKMGNTEAALRFLDKTLLGAPGSPDALWYKARILLDGRRNPAGALEILQGLVERGDLEPERLAEADQLMTRAREQTER
ncbi:uncharacterized protein involved in biosynthesis of c-type cytochromes [Saccharomonospora glauca K62]|uniref:Cytochrome c-type biogenesis protein n=3 Tax=Saccharomonospora TaxID=1851 RepID=I1D4G0_9PSEU|nr:uncharacterized protein involved in biosynthesis of c-type cytochromes [Saccharomonospora glauca K62]